MDVQLQIHKTCTRTLTYRHSPTHFLCVSCKTVFSSFSSDWRGSVGLMTFPVRHKTACGRQTAEVHVCSCENLYAYMHEFVKDLTHAILNMDWFEVSCVCACLLENVFAGIISA